MTESFDAQHLAFLVKTKRGNTGLRTVAKEIGGISPSTLSRVEQGKVPVLDTFIQLCKWLGVSPGLFMGDQKQEDDPITVPSSGSTPDKVAAHLRADRALDPKTAEAMAAMVRSAYEAALRGDI
ncbi:MAG: helix-turn-helix domain-containing protein [Candidatus Latescibacteria bacterium]|nr:helix-turn-helix domain-containing protein [Candidatus Latescibacterota bacterium]